MSAGFGQASGWGEPAPPPRDTGPAPLRARSPVAAPAVHHGAWERIRAAGALLFVATFLGALAAAVLGSAVWGIATLFHHFASG